jgi:hypothetical protein
VYRRGKGVVLSYDAGDALAVDDSIDDDPRYRLFTRLRRR